MAAKEKAAPVPTEKQREVLKAATGGRSVTIDESTGKKKVVVLNEGGKPLKTQPKLDRSAVEGCQKKGWLVEGKLTDEGRSANRRKAKV